MKYVAIDLAPLNGARAFADAAWMATTTLSEQSIALGSMPVAYPDFTNGKWMTRGRDTASGFYAL